MSENINTKLDGIQSLSELNRFIGEDIDIEPKVGLLSGRKFVKKEYEGELTLKHLVVKFKELSDVDTDKSNTLAILSKIKKLDKSANRILEQKNIFTRVFTNIKHLLTGFILSKKDGKNFYTERRSILSEIGHSLIGNERALYVADAYFDYHCYLMDIKENSNVLDLKDKILRSIKDPTNENISNLIDVLKQKELEPLVFRLMEVYRDSKDDIIKDRTAPLLVACYAYAKDIRVEEVQGPINEVRKRVAKQPRYYNVDRTWRVKNDPDFLKKAEAQHEKIKYSTLI